MIKPPKGREGLAEFYSKQIEEEAQATEKAAEKAFEETPVYIKPCVVDESKYLSLKALKDYFNCGISLIWKLTIYPGTYRFFKYIKAKRSANYWGIHNKDLHEFMGKLPDKYYQYLRYDLIIKL
jgi:hypothetical protein